MKTNSFSGITLIELLLVVSILAIISAVALPAAYQDINARINRNILATLKSDIEYARSMALLDMSEYSQVVLAGNSYTFAKQNKIFAADYSFGIGTIAFNNIGKPLSSFITIDVSFAGKEFGTINVSESGMVSANLE
ncbi:MAG: prepilin-type N-terminal cleavage/methylation domain-containing protein [Candidatus Riflebacteria bacterium]|nr:prepilin-type N-terminal cleavage/methylation domain-containing protein [Candidatus Riflebacteria bacterium]